MATPEASAESLQELAAVEDAIQRLTFNQMMETNEHTAAMARLFAQQQRIRQEQASQRALLEEILRRLPERQSASPEDTTHNHDG